MTVECFDHENNLPLNTFLPSNKSRTNKLAEIKECFGKNSKTEIDNQENDEEMRTVKLVTSLRCACENNIAPQHVTLLRTIQAECIQKEFDSRYLEFILELLKCTYNLIYFLNRFLLSFFCYC